MYMSQPSVMLGDHLEQLRLPILVLGRHLVEVRDNRLNALRPPFMLRAALRLPIPPQPSLSSSPHPTHSTLGLNLTVPLTLCASSILPILSQMGTASEATSFGAYRAASSSAPDR